MKYTMPSLHKQTIESHILLLEIDHPPANTLSKRMKIQFLELLEELEQTNDFRVVIITGRGNKFCSGDDLKEAAQNASKEGRIIENLKHFSAVIDRFEALPIPIVAAINGWCIGGGVELALCCDIRIAAENARFITAGVNVGLTASAYRLPRLIGVGRAKRMLLTGEAVDAQTAKEFGLVTDVFPKAVLLEEAIRLAKMIASKAPLAIKATKRIANVALEVGQEAGYGLQQKELEALAKSEDHRIALKAFQNKETPIFKGK